MADARITDLPALLAAADDDVLLIIDVSDKAASASGTDKKVTVAKVRASILAGLTAEGIGALSAALLGKPDGVARLNSLGQIPREHLPSIAITDTYVVENEAEMLALDVAQGDVAIREDVTATFIFKGGNSTRLSDWQELPTPTGVSVLSVNGKAGVVQLSAEDIGAIPVGQKAVPGGVATLDEFGKVPAEQLPEILAGGVESVNGQDGEVQLDAAAVGAVPAGEKGTPGGVATLDESGRIPIEQIPAGAGGEVAEAPEDGRTYGRKNKAWSQIDMAAVVEVTATAPELARSDGNWIIQMAGVSRLVAGSIASFWIDWSDGTSSERPAESGAASATKAITEAIGETVHADVRAVDDIGNMSAPLRVAATVAKFGVNQPSITHPDGITPAEIPLVVTASAFSTTPAGVDTHKATNWVVRNSSGAVVWDSGIDPVNLTSVRIPDGVLLPHTRYDVMVRHYGYELPAGAWSDPTTFTTGAAPFGKYLAVYNAGSPKLGVYGQSIDTFTNLPDLDILPTGNEGNVAFSPTGDYLAVAHSTAPFLMIYKRSGDTFTKLPDPAVLPQGQGRGVSFSPTGDYLAVAHNTAPFLTIYRRSGDTFTKLPDPAVLPTGVGYCAHFSPTGDYLAVGHMVAPFLTIYRRSGDTFTKLPEPAVLPTNEVYSVALGPSGDYLAAAHYKSPFLTIYKRSGDTFTKLPDPAVLPGSISGNGVSFSPTGDCLAVAHNTAPALMIYKRSGDTFTKLPNPAVLPTGNGHGVSFSPAGDHLAVAHSLAPFLTIYKRNGDTFAKLPNPAVLPTGLGRSVTFYSGV